MPELPEVETVARYINNKITGKLLCKVATPNNYKRALHKINSQRLTKLVRNKKILRVYRRAKYIVLQLEQGAICVHLRMTGELIVGKVPKNKQKYVTAWFDFRDGTRLSFQDTRKFGRIYFFNDILTLDQKLGIEPLSSKFNAAHCYQLLTLRKRQLKPLLLDQTVIAGIGNIYADEILWACRLHPKTSSKLLTKKHCNLIVKATKRILNKSIKLNGTTFKTFYFGEQKSGEFVNKLKVFDRTGEACPRCLTKIIKIRVAQRGTHVCPKCQKQK